jgi:hypothetical protein
MHESANLRAGALESIELYRRGEMLPVTGEEWLAALVIFEQMGWTPERGLAAYARPLTFIKHDEGAAMREAGQCFFSRVDDEPALSVAVPLDLGLFYRLTNFVGQGAFIVGREGSYRSASENDF